MTTHIVPIGFHSKQIYAPVKEYGADRIVLLIMGGRDSESKQKVKDAIDQAEQLCKSLAIVMEKKTSNSQFDMKEMLSWIDKIFIAEDDIVLNLTGGPKFLTLLLYITALKHYRKIRAITYVREDIHEEITLPKFVSQEGTTDFEKDLMGEISKKEEMTTKEISKNLGKSLPQILKYISSLEEKGLVKSRKEGQTRRVSLSSDIFV